MPGWRRVARASDRGEAPAGPALPLTTRWRPTRKRVVSGGVRYFVVIAGALALVAYVWIFTRPGADVLRMRGSDRHSHFLIRERADVSGAWICGSAGRSDP